MSRPTFRPARPSDLPFMIAQSVEDSVLPTGDDPTASDPHYAEAFATIVADPNQEIWIAELQDNPVGSFQITFIPGLMRHGMWRGQVEGVHIASEHRNKGLGAEMMRFAIERCRARGCGVVQLTSNKKRVDAHRFYRRLGFEASHEGFKLFL
jgi:GNAT superfamily N-acetyltransferase